MKQSPAQIYLAQERGVHETGGFRSATTFNFGTYFHPARQPFAGIYLFNDDVLDAGRTLNMEVPEASFVVLLPVMGAIGCTDPSGEENLVAAGQMQVFTASAGQRFSIRNPFPEGLVNFLQIWIRASVPVSGSYLTNYNPADHLNQFCALTPPELGKMQLPFSVSLGYFAGRGEATYIPKFADAKCFLFAIEGAFETEGRLLHARDGLGLWELESIETEALSHGAMMLLIEMGWA